MTDFSPGPSALDLALRQEAYERLVEEELLRLACAFLQDSEINAQLYAMLVGGAPPPDGSLETEPTLEAVVGKAAPSGLKLFRLGATGSFSVRAHETQSFLRALLWPAAREVARLKFAGPEKEPTTRELWARKLEVVIKAGKPEDAAAVDIADDDEAPEWVDEDWPNIFGGAGYPDSSETGEFTARDDNERLDARARAERACADLIALLDECDIDRKEWAVDVATLADQIDEMIEAGFGVRKNSSGCLTQEIYEAVAAALADVGETEAFVHYEYTGKIMDLARLVTGTKDGSRLHRVRQALNRERKRERSTASSGNPEVDTTGAPPVDKHHGDESGRT